MTHGLDHSLPITDSHRAKAFRLVDERIAQELAGPKSDSVTPSSQRSCCTSGIKLRALAVPLRDLDTVGPAKTEDER
jgi:hypothetical protein